MPRIGVGFTTLTTVVILGSKLDTMMAALSKMSNILGAMLGVLEFSSIQLPKTSHFTVSEPYLATATNIKSATRSGLGGTVTVLFASSACKKLEHAILFSAPNMFNKSTCYR